MGKGHVLWCQGQRGVGGGAGGAPCTSAGSPIASGECVWSRFTLRGQQATRRTRAGAGEGVRREEQQGGCYGLTTAPIPHCPAPLGVRKEVEVKE